MISLRASHAEVFTYLADRCGVGYRTIERTAERVRTKLPQAWPLITPGRARGTSEKLEVDPVHLTCLMTAVVGAPTIDDGPDGLHLFAPMVCGTASTPNVGNGIGRMPADPDPLTWSLGRYIFHYIVNQIDDIDIIFSLTVPIAQLVHRETKEEWVFQSEPRSDGKIFFPRFMNAAVIDRVTAMQTLRVAPGPMIAGLGGLLRVVEDAPPVRQRAANRLDDLKLAA